MAVMAGHGIDPVTQHSIACIPRFLSSAKICSLGFRREANTLARFRQHPRPPMHVPGSIHDPYGRCPQFSVPPPPSPVLKKRIREIGFTNGSAQTLGLPKGLCLQSPAVTFHARSSAHSFWKLLGWDQPDRPGEAPCDGVVRPKIKGRHCTRVFVSVPVSGCGDILFSLLLMLPRCKWKSSSPHVPGMLQRVRIIYTIRPIYRCG